MSYIWYSNDYHIDILCVYVKICRPRVFEANLRDKVYLSAQRHFKADEMDLDGL